LRPYAGLHDMVEIVPGEGLMQKPDAFGCSLGDYT
jgi:branched-chain amino acid transport system substrate-binding protein